MMEIHHCHLCPRNKKLEPTDSSSVTEEQEEQEDVAKILIEDDDKNEHTTVENACIHIK